MYLIRSSSLIGLETLLYSRGYNAKDFDSLIDINLVVINQPNRYISYERMAEFLELCANKSKVPFLGFELASFQGVDALNDLIISVSQEETIHKALEKLDRYLYLHASGVHIPVVPYGSNTRVEAHFQISSPLGLNQLAQLSVGVIANILSRLIGVDRKRLKLCLRQSKPVTPIGQNPPHGYQVVFNSDFDGVVVDSLRLKQKPRMNEGEAQKHFQAYLSSLQARYPNHLENQVREVISGLLPTGTCSIEKVAVSLNIHHRALQRQLKQRNTNYNSLLRDTRQAISEQYLHSSQVSITELALSLGYSEVSVFSRHFKSWTGLSPRQWRYKH